MEIRRLETGDEVALTRFLARIPEGDRTFFKEDVTRHLTGNGAGPAGKSQQE